MYKKRHARVKLFFCQSKPIAFLLLQNLPGIAEGNEKDLSGCRKDVLFMLNSTIEKIVCRNDKWFC